ncbi:MAG TPA: PEP-CTERM sorting domain-containing protein [Fimbriimonadaceae bacterium]|nr:PEP-CTERM sorting domain-containing protein [Fimbriimonadaceae bacterium]
MKTKLSIVALALVAGSAMAAPGDKIIVANDGEVVAKFLGHSAAYTNDLYLDDPVNGLGIIFTNQTTPVGTEVSLGNFTAGTELIFRLYVRNTDTSYYTGPDFRNPDGYAHADVVQAYGGHDEVTGVFFEDLYGGPFHYNDLGFSFTNTIVPEPASMAALGIGMAALIRRRRK